VRGAGVAAGAGLGLGDVPFWSSVGGCGLGIRVWGCFFLDGGKLKEEVLVGNLPVWTQQHCVGSYERCD
jgi:hypothetical protein